MSNTTEIGMESDSTPPLSGEAKGCRQCGNDQAGIGGLCLRCRAATYGKWGGKYHFSPEHLELIRQAYCGKKSAVTAGISSVVRKTGYPRHAVLAEARRRGLSRCLRRWTGEELRILDEKIGVISLKRIAMLLNRTAEVVGSMAAQRLLLRRGAEGYGLADLQVVFGESASKVRSWMKRGWLGNENRTNDAECRVSKKEVIEFMQAHYHEWDMRRVNQLRAKTLLFGEQAMVQEVPDAE